MSKARNMADLLDSNGDVVTGALDNVPPSNDASALTTGTLPVDRVPYLGRRNLIINGGFDVWQRGTSASSFITGYRSADRWAIQRVSDGGTFTNESESQYVLSQAEINLTGHNKAYSISGQVSGGGSAAKYERVQKLEIDVQKYANKELTLSFWAKGSTSGNVYVRFFARTDGSNGQELTSEAVSINLSTSFQKFTHTFTMPSVGGAYDSNVGYFGVFFQTHSEANSIDYSGTLYLTGVQLEVGSVATPFEHRSYGEELALCQRYYAKSYDVDVAPGTSGVASGGIFYRTTSASAQYKTVQLPVNMRSQPTVTYYNGNNGNVGTWRGSSSVDYPVSTYVSGQRAFSVSLGVINNQFIQNAHWVAEAEL